MQQEVVIPDYERFLKAIDLDVDYNQKLGQGYADAGKASALFSVRLIGVALGLAFLLSTLLAWLLIRSTNRALSNITVNLDRGAVWTASPPGRYRWRARPLLPGPVNKRPPWRKPALRWRRCPA